MMLRVRPHQASIVGAPGGAKANMACLGRQKLGHALLNGRESEQQMQHPKPFSKSEEEKIQNS